MTDYTTLWHRANAAVSAIGLRDWDRASAVWNRFLAWWDARHRCSGGAWFAAHRTY